MALSLVEHSTSSSYIFILLFKTDITDNLESPSIGLTRIDTLPFGACQDPITDLYLFTTWSNISEEVVTESDVYR